MPLRVSSIRGVEYGMSGVDPSSIERIDVGNESGGDGEVERDAVGVKVREQGKMQDENRTCQGTSQKRIDKEKSAKKRNKIV